jgi:hypothetical protein
MNCAMAQDFMKFFHDAAAGWIEPFILFRSPTSAAERRTPNASQNPQRERLPCSQTRILMINKFEPTVVIGSEVRFWFSKTEALKGALVFFGFHLHGDKIFIT